MDETLEYDAIVQTHWKFLYKNWPIIDRVNHHRTEIAPVNDIETIKSFVLNRLGVIPVFFFLIVIFGTKAYSCPYRNVEKGVMLLYVLVKGVSLSDMARHIPKTSFHTIHKEFYMYTPALNRLLTTMLSEMFSTLKSRHFAAERNPDPFKNVTLNLDGHDSRIIYTGADKPSLYSYKLKKSGFRVQVCTDMNNMVFFASAPAPCRDYNDGTMLLRLGIQSRIHKLDCVALDGGYNLFIGKLLDSADELQYENFCYPVRKTRGIALTEEEKAYNDIFGSFRSRIEGYFGEMQSTFTKFSHTVVNKVAEKETFGVQYKLACVLMNIKKFVALRSIPTEQHHTLWLQDGFDYPSVAEQETVYTLPNIKVKLSQSQDLLATRKAFFDMAIFVYAEATDEDMHDAREHEIKVTGHRGEGDAREYQIIEKSTGLSMATWVPVHAIADKMRIVEYLKSRSRLEKILRGSFQVWRAVQIRWHSPISQGATRAARLFKTSSEPLASLWSQLSKKSSLGPQNKKKVPEAAPGSPHA